MHTFTGRLEKFDGKLWSYHIKVPEDMASLLLEDKNRRITCTLNETHAFPCALMHSNGFVFVNINKQIRAKLGLVMQQEVHVQIVKDTSEYGMEVPEELEVMLEQDEEGKRYFDQLTKGKQRSLIYLVLKVKNTNSRINKSLAIVHHLKEVEGQLDYKLLNETIKMYNQLNKLKS